MRIVVNDGFISFSPGKPWSLHPMTVILMCSVVVIICSGSAAMPGASASPAMARSSSKEWWLHYPRTDKRAPKPKWINPCGLRRPHRNKSMSDRHHQHFGKDVEPLSDRQLLANIILAAKNALSHSAIFKEDYVRPLKL